MILESYYWRKELIKTSKKLPKLIDVKKEWSPTKYAKFEKEIMFGFYIIRKLIEANKLTNKLVSTKRECKVYLNTGTKINIRNNHRFNEYYDFDNFTKKKFDLKFLNNQFVHSYIFSPVINVIDEKSLKLLENESLTDEKFKKTYEDAEKEVVAILFNSDTNKNQSLFEIDIKKVIEIFNDVGNCNVTSIKMEYNSKKDDWDVFQSDDVIVISPEIEKIINQMGKKLLLPT